MANNKQTPNPYVYPETEPGNAPDARRGRYLGLDSYANKQLPESSDPNYTTGYATALESGGSADAGVPSDLRIDTREPPPNNPNNHAYNRKRHRNFFKRHSVEDHDIGWDVKQQAIPAPNVPKWNQTLSNSRPTQDNSPDGYRFTRPWHVPRPIQRIFGNEAVAHFSLANHRRVTAIYGMQPRGGLTPNTYRVQPRPWDEDFYVNAAPQVEDQSATAGLFGANNAQRSGRLF